jgi:hypothetical protein
VIGHPGLDYAVENPRGSMTVKTLLVMVATMLFAWLLAAGLTLLIGHTGAWIPLALVGAAAIAVTLWLLKSER